ncbi:MAG TPA: sigma 54 modulation/S30EA ribosomal C-terminal domain-containing protein [Acidimicrobiia bacterium]
MTTMTPLDGGVVVTGRGDVTRRDRSYAHDKVAHVLRFARAPVRYSRVVLTKEPDPARERPAIAEADVDVDGQPVRVKVAAERMHTAIDLLEARLRRRLDRLADRERSTHLRHRDEAWHHGDAAAHRPPYFDRPPDEREIVRRKTFASVPMTIHDAVREMDLLDHDFFLFTNADTGQDEVLQRRPGGRHVLRRPAAAASVDDAIALLDLGQEPFVFFFDGGTGRGRVLYRRYDGHYGLITQSDE